MSANTWLIIAIVGFSLSGIALVVAIFMFIKMDIPAIIGDLTGKTVAREIKAMREANASSGDKSFRSSAVNIERGTLTENVSQKAIDAEAMKKAHASKRLDKTTSELGSGTTKTRGNTIGLFGLNKNKQREEIPPTEHLNNATEVLNQNATEVLNSTNATEVLSNGTTVLSNGTTVLSQTEELIDTSITPVAFKVIRSEIVIHSQEVI